MHRHRRDGGAALLGGQNGYARLISRCCQVKFSETGSYGMSLLRKIKLDVEGVREEGRSNEVLNLMIVLEGVLL